MHLDNGNIWCSCKKQKIPNEETLTHIVAKKKILKHRSPVVVHGAIEIWGKDTDNQWWYSNCNYNTV